MSFFRPLSPSFPPLVSLSPSLVSSLLTKREFCATITRIFSALAPLLISIFRLSPSHSISLCLPLYYSGWQSSCHELEIFAQYVGQSQSHWPFCLEFTFAIIPFSTAAKMTHSRMGRGTCCGNLKSEYVWHRFAPLSPRLHLRLRLVGHSL